MTLPDLIDCLQKAEGPSMELDGLIYNALIGVDAHDAKRWYGGGVGVTESIDAAIAFMRRVLKGVVIRTLLNEDDMACKAQICCMPNGLSQEPQINVDAWHQHEAIALVIATLRALSEHEEAGR